MAYGKGGGIPAIALTAYAGDNNRDRALAAGFQRPLTKPLNLELLGQTLPYEIKAAPLHYR